MNWISAAAVSLFALTFTAAAAAGEAEDCQALVRSDNLTIFHADLRRTADGATQYCYAKGLIAGRITYHVQLPLPGHWNGRFIHLGDGGADGDLDYADAFVARGYAVANSNTGHDLGAAGDAYGYADDVAAADFAWRAVHLTTNAGKTIVANYYKKAQDFAYHVGCSTGGRQGLVSAQVFPNDFDGIIAGAPAYRQLPRMTHRLATVKQLSEHNYRANLAFDTDDDGMPDSLAKLELLRSAVIERCDANDGVVDGVIEPALCDFDVERDLARYRCPGDVDAERCFTSEQLRSVHQIYDGTRNSAGAIIYPGGPVGSEFAWAATIVPHAGNRGVPYFLSSAAPVIAYTMYRVDPGLLPDGFGKPGDPLDTDSALPEWGWWQVNPDDFSRADLSASARALDATDPDLQRYLVRKRGKLLLYQGLADAVIPPQSVIDYYDAVVKTTFANNADEARAHMRLFLAPGMSHCSGGPGPDQVDWLSLLTAWVENAEAPERALATHLTNGTIDNERPLCPYPQRAAYTGPDGGANDRTNWRAANFTCH